jgi:hypothetical protein
MDPDVLRSQGIDAGEGRKARVDGQALRLGERATLVPQEGARAYGMTYALEAAQLQALYSTAGLEAYVPIVVQVRFEGDDGEGAAAECWVLATPPEAATPDPDYEKRLREVLGRLGFPAEYVATVGRQR